MDRKTRDREHIVGTETTFCNESNLSTVTVFRDEEKAAMGFSLVDYVSLRRSMVGRKRDLQILYVVISKAY